MDDEYDERLWIILDQLSSPTSVTRGEWYTTTAALRSLEKLLTRISFGNDAETKTFAEISFPSATDPLFAWFSKAQDDLGSNLTSHLIVFLRLLSSQLTATHDDDTRTQFLAWTCRVLNSLQGALLLHERSRSLFSRRLHMTLLTDLLSPTLGESVHIEVIQTLVSALVDRPENSRMFEVSNGLERVSKLFLHEETGHKVKVRVLEFLYFYLIPEIPVKSAEVRYQDLYERQTASRKSQASQASTMKIRQHVREGAEDGTVKKSMGHCRTTKEKQVLLGRYFSNIDALVKDLNEFKPFGELQQEIA